MGREQERQEEGQSVSLQLLGGILLDMSKFKYPKEYISRSHNLSVICSTLPSSLRLALVIEQDHSTNTGPLSYLPSYMQQTPAFEASLSMESALGIFSIHSVRGRVRQPPFPADLGAGVENINTTQNDSSGPLNQHVASWSS